MLNLKRLLIICASLALLLGRRIHAQESSRNEGAADYYFEYVRSIGDEAPGGIGAPWAIASHEGSLYVLDRGSPTPERGRILKFSGNKGSVVAECPRPMALDIDRTTGSIIVGGGEHHLFRITTDGSCEPYVMTPTRTDSVAGGSNGTVFVSNSLNPSFENILQFNSSGEYVRSFGGWSKGESRHGPQAYLAHNLQQIRFVGQHLYAMGIATSNIRRFAEGELVAENHIDTSPYNPEARESIKENEGGVAWINTVLDVAPLNENRFLVLIAAKHDNQPGRILGLVVSRTLAIQGRARLSQSTDPLRVSPAFNQVVRLSEDTFVFLDKAFKRIDILRTVAR